VDSLDYEVELGVILKRDAFWVSEEEAGEYILGYTIINDVSARNIQLKHQQWYRGKSLDGYTPMGPCIVTADELEDVHNLSLTCFVNDEKRQDSNTAYMITTIEEAISELSQGMTLRAGTIIATGTPGGVGMGFKPPKFLKPGDVVKCVIDGIGELTNTVAL
jgi:2-keto-4-pentenoate hydratase/2-oxohepta-3-ene-1,7-dioic acid hydratase in catechol pathway